MKTMRWGSLFVLVLPLLGATDVPPSDSARPNLTAQLAAHLTALQDIQTLQSKFTCTRDIVGTDLPLTSNGHLFVQAGNRKPGSLVVAAGSGGAVHLRTENPYTSETILRDGKFAGRSQHEVRWQVSNQSGTGLTAVLGQIAGWCVGDPGKLDDWFSVEPPAKDANAETFLLTPRLPDLQRSLKNITLTFDPRTHQLQRARITSAQDDATTYVFSDWQLNAAIPKEIFTYDGK